MDTTLSSSERASVAAVTDLVAAVGASSVLQMGVSAILGWDGCDILRRVTDQQPDTPEDMPDLPTPKSQIRPAARTYAIVCCRYSDSKASRNVCE